MQVFVYEFVTGGGWWPVGELPVAGSLLTGSLLAEGRAMARAITEDFARIDTARVWTTRDERLPAFHDTRCQVRTVHSAEESRRAVAELARAADWTMLIAPESGHHLRDLAQLVREARGRLLSPDFDVIALAGDKQATAEHLAAHHVRVPAGTTIDLGGAVDAAAFPAVVKPNDGCGSMGVRLVHSAGDLQDFVSGDPAGTWLRLERFIPGAAASVSVLCGPGELVTLPACRQLLSDDGHFRYLGGRLPLPSELDLRARRLALAAASTLPSPLGYIGVDLVLGDDPAGGRDYVIEINPRLTTSYIGLRALCRENLAAAMLAVASGQPPALSWRAGSVEFAADGHLNGAPGGDRQV